MKRILPLAAIAVLGLSIAGYATIVLAQGSDPLPPPSGPGVTLPKPVADKPKDSLPPGLDLPAPGDSKPVLPPPSGGDKPALPAPSAPLDLPSAPPSAPAITIPPAGTPAGDSKPAVTPLPKPGDLDTTPAVKPNEPGPAGGPVTIPPATGAEKPAEKAIENPRHLSAGTDEAGSGANDNNPTGRQEPAVSLEWVGPAAAKVGQATDYTIAVRNVCNIAVQQVLVRVRLTPGMQVVATEPKAVTEENIMMWEIGTMLPKQEKNLQLKLMAPARGDANCQAWVTFTGSSAMRIAIREPKLLIKTTAPEKVMVGDPCTFVVTVSNPGDHPCEQVKLHCDLSEGLEHARGNKIDFDIGTLAAGETRAVQVICGTKAGGAQTCESYSEAEGGLKATDKVSASVVMPRLDVEATGPKLKYLDRKAVYTIKVTNPGDAPAFNVSVSDAIPTGFKFLQADNGGRHDFSTRTVQWFLGEIAPGQSREVKFECLAVNIGDHQHKILAQGSRGLKQESAVNTKVDGLSAIMLEMVDLDDPIEVGGETAYEIRITNTGSKTETDVKLVCVVPDKMQFKGATGPVKYTQNGNEIIFEPIARLAPRADAIFRVNVKTTAAGVVHFKSRLTSTLLTEPVTKEEATRIYSD
jgi:uncharacterized repeat protein (TIGR01451 family)